MNVAFVKNVVNILNVSLKFFKICSPIALERRYTDIDIARMHLMIGASNAYIHIFLYMIIFDLLLTFRKIQSHDDSAFDIATSINSMVVQIKIQLSSVNDDTYSTYKK